jgi:hypothetical protein
MLPKFGARKRTWEKKFERQRDYKRADMNCHPTTSGSSHLLEGVLLGASQTN